MQTSIHDNVQTEIRYDREFLDRHYQSILDHNRETFLNGGTGDPRLANAKQDSRRSLALLIRIPTDISERIMAMEEDLRKIEPDLYLYPACDHHITVMDVLKGEDGRTIPEDLDRYIACVKDCARQITPFSITLDGLTASDSAIMVRGYYERQLQTFRELLRTSFAANGLELQERYKTVSSHMTIARNRHKIQNPRLLLQYMEQEHYFGTMQVDSIELTFHNWYDTIKKELYTVHL